MANNYTQFSFELPESWSKVVTDDMVELMNKMQEGDKAADDLSLEICGDTGGLCGVEVEFDNVSNVMFCEEGCILDNVANFLQYIMKKHNLDGKMGFEYSFSCSKMRPGEFGGGAICVDKEGVEWCIPSSWLAKKLK